VILAETGPVDWLLPNLLGLAWLTLWVTRREISPRFFAVGAVLAVLCFPAGMIASRQELTGANCTPDNLCFSADAVDWWWNGILGVFTTGALALVTVVITTIIAVVRRVQSPRAR
jgi:uncharacterized membrane protein